MKAAQIDVKTLLEGSRQYVLPLYQRRYSWTTKHWQTLANDLDRLLNEPERRSHFIGSFVSAPLEAAAHQTVNRYRLIDGQQRLTTLIILLAALRDVASEAGQPELGDEIQGLYLSNQFQKADAAKKLLLTEDDRPQMASVLERPAKPAGDIGKAYLYFADRFRKVPTNHLADARQAAMGRLTAVSVTLEAGDDPYMIFESLNAKGERLTQADLLRNYFLMRLPQGEADEHFARLWRPMEKDLDRDLTGFFRHYLMRTSDGGDVRRDEVYFHAKGQVDHDAATPADVVGKLEEIRRYAWYYARLISPHQFERDPASAARVTRLHHLKSTTAYPFLLNVLEAVGEDRLTVDAYTTTLDLIERFLVRRMVCGIPTNQLRQIFLGLCRPAATATNAAAFLSELRAALSHKQRCPTDAIFRDGLVNRPLYGGSRRDGTRYVLNRIEAEYGHKEAPDPAADGVQIEHVMPQTLSREWRDKFTPDHPAISKEDHARWLDTLGNLTLTAYNPELGNLPYPDKQARYAESNFGLNRYFAGVDKWDAAAIRARGEALANEAIRIWPDVAEDRTVLPKIARAKPTPPAAVMINGERIGVESMLDAAVRVFQAMHDRDAGAFDKALAKAVSKRRRATAADGMRAPRRIGKWFVDFHGSGDDLQGRCAKLVQAMSLPAGAVTFEFS